MNKFTTKEIIENFDDFKGKSLRFYTWPKGVSGTLVGRSTPGQVLWLQFEEMGELDFPFSQGYWEIAYSPTTNFILED